VRVQAFERYGSGSRASDPDVELGPNHALLCLGMLEAGGELRIGDRQASPAFHPACRFEARDRSDEMGASEPESGREGRSRVVVRVLLGDGGKPERAADYDATESSRRAAQLALDNGTVTFHHRRS
jgi:hypothetical protein